MHSDLFRVLQKFYNHSISSVLITAFKLHLTAVLICGCLWWAAWKTPEHFSLLTLYTLTSVSIFSLLFSISFFWNWQGEFIWWSKLLRLVNISFIHMILMNGLAVLLSGEIRCWSLLGFKGLKLQVFYQSYFALKRTCNLEV